MNQETLHRDSPRFDLDGKTVENPASLRLARVPFWFLTLCVLFLYGSSTNSRQCISVPLWITRVNDGGITIPIRYGTCTVKLIAARATTIGYGLMVIMIMLFGDNV